MATSPRAKRPPVPEETLPAERPPPSPDAYAAPTGHYPVAPVPEASPTRDEPYAGMAQLGLSPEERRALTVEIPAEFFDVLPSGEIYLPQVQYRNLLNRVLGPGEWGLMPLGEWGKQGNTVVREWALLIRGKCVAVTVGEQDYVPGNPRMSWATAAEASKSNALMRACKDLGIAAQAWDKRWAQWFQETHCVRVWVEKDPRNPGSGVEAKWRLKTAGPFMYAGKVIEREPVTGRAYRRPQAVREAGDDDERPREEPPSDLERALEASVDQAQEMREHRELLPPTRSLAGPIDDKQVQQLWIEARRAGKSEAQVYAYLREHYRYESVKALMKAEYAAFMAWVQRPSPRGTPQPAGRVVCRRTPVRR